MEHAQVKARPQEGLHVFVEWVDCVDSDVADARQVVAGQRHGQRVNRHAGESEVDSGGIGRSWFRFRRIGSRLIDMRNHRNRRRTPGLWWIGTAHESGRVAGLAESEEPGVEKSL